MRNRKQEKKLLTRRYNYVKMAEITELILSELCEGGSPSCEVIKLEHSSKTATENEKDNIKVCVCSLFSGLFIHLSLNEVMDSFSCTVSLFSMTTRKGSSVWTFILANHDSVLDVCHFFSRWGYNRDHTVIKS